MPNALSLDLASLVRDLEGAQSALGIRLAITEEAEQGAHLRVSTKRTYEVALPAGSPVVRARFVRQGLAQEAKKIFVKEIEVGEKVFDDAVYIATDTPDTTRALVTNARVQEALVALVKLDCVIDVRDGKLVVVNPEAGTVGKDAESAQVIALASFLLPKG